MAKKFEPPSIPVFNESTFILWNLWFHRIADTLKFIEHYSVTFDPSSIAANTTSEQSITVPGVLADDIAVSVSKPSHTAGIGIVNSRVSANDTVAVTFMNTTAGAINPGSETYEIVVLRG